MSDFVDEVTKVFQSKDVRRRETDKVFAAIVEQERRERLEKTVRLKKLRLRRN